MEHQNKKEKTLSQNFVFNDGGRAEAGFKGTTGDCVVRSIAIAAQLPYQQVYDELNILIKSSYQTKRAKNSSSRTGVSKKFYHKYLQQLGWTWVPVMKIGTGCKMHLRQSELPKGRLIVRCSQHLTAVINGVIHDIYDPSRGGTRCVYGYFVKESQ